MKKSSSLRSWIKVILFAAAAAPLIYSLITRYGIISGLLLFGISWSAFVLATPFFGGGVLFFPFVIGGTPSYVTEAVAWIFSVLFNLILVLAVPEVYFKTPITHWFYWALTHPVPYWILAPFTAAPILLSYLYVRHDMPQSAILYYHIRYVLIIATLIVFFYCTSFDGILMSNIHS